MAGIDNTIIFSSGERLTESTATDIIRMQETSDSVSRINYEGDPEGVISANPSSLCHDPVSGNIYFKQTGTGNTGWVLLTGGGGSVTITADDGNSITTSPYDLFGQKAGTVPVMSTAITGGKLFMANNAFETQYVIDPSTTLGLEGTFQTIQAALDQAVIDGMTYTNPKKFILRPATYIEDLTIPGGAFFYSAGGPTDPQTSPPFVTVQGNHTLADICLWSTEGVQWITNAGTMFTAGATFLLMTSINSTFRNAGTGLILDATAGTTVLTWTDSVFSTGRSDQGTVFNIASGQGMQFINCQFNGCGFEKNQGVLRFTQCQQVGEINQTGDTNGIISVDTVHAGSSNSCVYGVGSGTFIVCSFINNDSTKYGVDLAGGCFLIGCNMYPGVSNPGDFLSPATQAASGYSYDQVGNVLKAIRSATDLTNTTQANYVGITDTSAARSVVINPGPVDYQVFVCDESGGAATNNITVTSQSGIALINGQASYIINQNYGCVLFHWDGTNWFTTSGSNNVSTANANLQFSNNILDFKKSDFNINLGSSLPSLSGGTFNTGLGYNANNALTTPGSNVSIGAFANAANDTGSQNTCIGTTALSSAVGSTGNTAIGNQALGNYTGVGGTGLGQNIAIGNVALDAPFDGNYNIGIGVFVGKLWNSSESNNILIGSDGVAGENNTIRIGMAGSGQQQQNRAFMAGITGVTVSASAPVLVDTNGQLSSAGFGTALQVYTSNGAGNSPTFQSPVTSNTATSAIAAGSAVSLTTGTPANITSISLAAGTWVVSVLAEFGGTPTVSGPQQISVSTTSATHGTVGDNSAQSVTLTTNFTAGPVAMTIPSYILTVGSTTTVYFVASGDFSGGSLTAYGRISAFRIA